jgi:hypothetical protein
MQQAGVPSDRTPATDDTSPRLWRIKVSGASSQPTLTIETTN